MSKENQDNTAPIMEDPIGLDLEMLAEINCTINKIRSETKSEAILQACDVLEEIAREGSPLKVVCKTRIALQKMLAKEELDSVREDIEICITRLKEIVEERRNPDIPLLPDRIITYPTTLFNGAPWYCAEYKYTDSRQGAPTEEPHLAFIRTPGHIAKNGENLTPELIQKIFRDKVVPLRMHSECLLGDAFYSGRCDCGQQRKNAMLSINEQEMGVLLYLRQEGRGIGLHEKTKALELEDGRRDGEWIGGKMDTEEAMHDLGYKADLRRYEFVAKILRGLGITKVSIMTHNQGKIQGLEKNGIEVVSKEVASGVAVTINNLTELLWKMICGYKGIPYESIAMIGEQIDILRRGQRIDDILYKMLQQILDIIHSGKKHSFPPRLVELVKTAANELENGHGHGDNKTRI